jgi:PAS domain S-box-containing protein
MDGELNLSEGLRAPGKPDTQFWATESAPLKLRASHLGAAAAPAVIIGARLLLRFEAGITLTTMLIALTIPCCASLGGVGLGLTSNLVALLGFAGMLLWSASSVPVAASVQAALCVQFAVAGCLLSLLGHLLRKVRLAPMNPSQSWLRDMVLRGTLFYGVSAATWALLVDSLLGEWVVNPTAHSALELTSDWAFVGISSCLLYLWMTVQVRREELESEKRRAAEAARRLWADAFEHCAHGIAVGRGDVPQTVACNSAFARLHGMSEGELLQIPPLDLYAPSAQPYLEHSLREADRLGHLHFEALRQRADGSVFPAQIDLVSVKDEAGSVLCRVATVQDITERRAHEREIERLSQLYESLSAINGTIVRAKSRQELFEGICQAAVEHAGFKLVWIGWCEEGELEVQRLAWAGESRSYLEQLHVYVDDRPEGRGPTGTCIRENRPCVFNDFLTNAHCAPWHTAAAACGIRAVAALPLQLDGKVCGAFTVYSDEIDAFHGRELELLAEAARDTSFALSHLEHERKRLQTECDLRASEERFRQMAEALGEVFWLASAEDDSILYVNPAFERLWGRPCADLYSDPRLWLEMIHPEDKPRVLQSLAELARGKVYDIEYRILRPDGGVRWVNDRGYPQYDSAGRVVRTCGVAADVTERKNVEIALAAESTRRRILFEQSPDGIVITDPESARIVEFNQAAHRQLGYTREEFAALTLPEIVAGKTPEQIWAVTRRVMREGSADFESQHRTKQGELRTVRVTVQRVEVPGQVLHQAVWRDMTESRRNEERVRKLSRAVEQSPAVIMITDLSGSIEYVNPKFTELTGYSLEEVRGRNPRLLKSGETPPQEYRRLWKTISQGGEWQGELHNRKKTGELYWEYASISPIVDDAGHPTHFLAVKEDITQRKEAEEILRRQSSLFDQTYDAVLVWEWDGPLTFWNRGAELLYGYRRNEALGQRPHALLKTGTKDGFEGILRALEQHSRWEGELEQTAREGQRIRLESRMVLVRELGRAHVLEVNRDITTRQQLEDQLRQAQKMEAVGRLAGGVAHDFNNILGVVLGYCSLVLDKLEDPALRKQVEEIHKAGQRATALTRQLLAFSRKQLLEPRVLNLNHLITDLEKMLHRLLGEDVTLKTVLDPALGRVRVDPGQIEQVLMNLAVNSRDAMPQGGLLTLETRNIGPGAETSGHGVSLPPGSYAQLLVADTGTGMDEKIRAHIFEPFFTTKKNGTGLGLATVHGIVKQSGGHISVESEPGKGTAFFISFPCFEQPVEESQPRSAGDSIPRGSETILLVEDAEPMLAVAKEFLDLGGYTVLAASSGAEALKLLAEREAPVDLLLTDVVMPGMSGPQLADKIKALRPKVRVLFMSGYTESAIANHGVLAPGQNLIMKPFSRQSLALKVREMLSSP